MENTIAANVRDGGNKMAKAGLTNGKVVIYAMKGTSR